MFENFPARRFILRGKAMGDLLMPAYAGSKLRGAWGQTLLDMHCVKPKADCSSCAVAANCAVRLWFDPPAVDMDGRKVTPAAPYVIEPWIGQEGASLAFWRALTVATKQAQDAAMRGNHAAAQVADKMTRRMLHAGEEFEFGLVLTGPALRHLPSVIKSWRLALRRKLSSDSILTRL